MTAHYGTMPHVPAPRAATSPSSVRVGVTHRDGRLYVSVDDVVAQLCHRAAAYRQRADELTAAAVDPSVPVDPQAGDPVPILEEALACRMVAEELEQRADFLDQLGR